MSKISNIEYIISGTLVCFGVRRGAKRCDIVWILIRFRKQLNAIVFACLAGNRYTEHVHRVWDPFIKT